MAGLAQVAVERSVDRYPDGLTYALPASLLDLRAGERVQVPLGSGGALVAGAQTPRRSCSAISTGSSPASAPRRAQRLP